MNFCAFILSFLFSISSKTVGLVSSPGNFSTPSNPLDRTTHVEIIKFRNGSKQVNKIIEDFAFKPIKITNHSTISNKGNRRDAWWKSIGKRLLQKFIAETGKDWRTSETNFKSWLQERRRAGGSKKHGEEISQKKKDDMYYYGSNYHSYMALNEHDYIYEKDYVEADFDGISQITVETPLVVEATTDRPRGMAEKEVQYSYYLAGVLIVFGVLHIKLYRGD